MKNFIFFGLLLSLELVAVNGYGRGNIKTSDDMSRPAAEFVCLDGSSPSKTTRVIYSREGHEMHQTVFTHCSDIEVGRAHDRNFAVVRIKDYGRQSRFAIGDQIIDVAPTEFTSGNVRLISFSLEPMIYDGSLRDVVSVTHFGNLFFQVQSSLCKGSFSVFAYPPRPPVRTGDIITQRMALGDESHCAETLLETYVEPGPFEVKVEYTSNTGH